jgi:putative endonuclease
VRCFVYILGSTAKSGHRTYVGWTNDLDRRLARHNAGRGARSTRGRIWFLLYAERYASRKEAMSREWYLKRDRAFRKRLSKAVQNRTKLQPYDRREQVGKRRCRKTR